MALGFENVLFSSQVDGAALSNTVTATSLLPAQAKAPLAGGLMDFIGKMLRIRATGRISTVVTTPGTLTLDLRYGSTVIWNGGAMTLNTTAQTNATWDLEVLLTLRALGATGNAIGVGKWASRAIIGSAAAAAGAAGALLLPDTAPAVGTNFDTTAAQSLDLFATWSVANASNSILCHQFLAELLN